MFDRPRNWKWMVPASLVPVCVWWWNDWYMAGGKWAAAAVIPFVLSLILGIAALVNLVLYVYHYSADMYAEIRASQNNTPEVRMFEAAKGMHPEAVKALTVHRRTIWRMKYVPIVDLVDWILDEADNVHAGFVDFVLEHSSHVGLMPKRMLSDGSKQFDPDDLVTDYEQYTSLLLLLQQKLMVTQAYGNQAPQWLPPWNPEMARHRFGLDGAVGAEPEDLSDVVMAVSRARQAAAAGGGGNGALKELPADESTKRVVKQQSFKRDVPEISDDEFDAIQKEISEYRSKFSDGKAPS